MREIILTLIKDMSGTFMVAFVALVAFLPISIIVAAVRRDKKLLHSEKMNALKYNHDEVMFKLDRELPKVVGSERALEHQAMARRVEDR